ncbi:NUDIX domain-containing protein [Kiritimatiellota bacterium B12222]|nr:NUDIX domain-containing protein [Kiritimatiellota bacterium B12222]
MQELADSYTHCPSCGSTDFTHLPQHQRACKDCGHRDFNNPITGVAVLVLADDGEMCWIRRGRNPGKGKLGMPGGFVDAGESLEQAAIREVQEETGLQITNLRYLCSFPNAYIYNGHPRPVCDAFFIAYSDDKSVRPLEGEVQACFWQSPESVVPQDLAFDSMRFALKCFLCGDSEK